MIYNNSSSTLFDEIGLKKHKYDLCVMNKQMNGNQCTIIWHVVDIKIFHKDQQVVTSIIIKLDEKYGNIMPLSVSRGKIHEYLGIVLDYTAHGQVKNTMYQYIHELIKHVPQMYKEGI